MRKVLAPALLTASFGLFACADRPPTAPSVMPATAMSQAAASGGGFDEFGYNYNARIFNGTADAFDRVLDGLYQGSPTYANDHLVAKWSKAWDDAQFHGAPWTPNAWTDNEWNGNCAGCSGQVWHYKIIWNDGQFEIIMSQGHDPNVGPGHLWLAHVIPTGYGNK